MGRTHVAARRRVWRSAGTRASVRSKRRLRLGEVGRRESLARQPEILRRDQPVLGVGEDECPAFTEYGVKCLRQIIIE